MSIKTATIIGASGLIGSHLLNDLLQGNDYDFVRTLVRWPGEPLSPKHEVKLVNFDDTESLMLALEESSVVFCTIGTTQQKVKGNKTLYRKIDHDIPVKVCRLAKECGCEKFILVSSVGADKNSATFYLKLKGETEADLITTGVESLHIMQPSLLLGNRKEKRFLEKFSQVIMKPVSKLLGGSLAKYSAIDASDVAKAMIAASLKPGKGVFRYTYTEMLQLVS